MSRKITFHCDRCGKEFERGGLTRFLSLHRKLTDFLWWDAERCTETEYDLCQECTRAFYEFIHNKEVKPNA